MKQFHKKVFSICLLIVLSFAVLTITAHHYRAPSLSTLINEPQVIGEIDRAIAIYKMKTGKNVFTITIDELDTDGELNHEIQGFIVKSVVEQIKWHTNCDNLAGIKVTINDNSKKQLVLDPIICQNGLQESALVERSGKSDYSDNMVLSEDGNTITIN
ncbi:MAG: hypothetical protein HAW67_01450 [Endozoicomonadaceae bacterium]|nr:hypothetical protein [Endozoicomonadaceae bacterium]